MFVIHTKIQQVQTLDKKQPREMDNFIVTSDGYPGISAKVSDLILPSAMIYEKMVDMEMLKEELNFGDNK